MFSKTQSRWCAVLVPLQWRRYSRDFHYLQHRPIAPHGHWSASPRPSRSHAGLAYPSMKKKSTTSSLSAYASTKSSFKQWLPVENPPCALHHRRCPVVMAWWSDTIAIRVGLVFGCPRSDSCLRVQASAWRAAVGSLYGEDPAIFSASPSMLFVICTSLHLLRSSL